MRIATFNVSLFGENPGDLQKRLEGSDEQLSALVSIVRLVNPDILILTEFDHDPFGASLAAFADKLDLGYRHRLALSSNTGVRSGEDLDRDGRKDHAIGTRGYAADAYGYGRFPGQYASALLSRFPIDRQHTRTFQEFLWEDLPDNLLPKDYF
ncbi:MAG: endonuclease/exonuclease/phosphatase family protein [Pseudomonadota bacterium]